MRFLKTSKISAVLTKQDMSKSEYKIVINLKHFRLQAMASEQVQIALQALYWLFLS